MSSVRGVNVGGFLFDVTDSSNVAPIQLTNFATRPYAKDRCFIMADGLLYRATAEIENGAPIVINGNCKRTTLDEIISVIETDSDLIAPTEDGATSSDDYVVGDEIVRSGILYNVISAIAEGDAFVIGNNIDIAGSLTSQIKTLANNDNAMLNVLGAKNLLPYPYGNSNIVVNGITYTDNGDGTITANGTATADSSFTIASNATSSLVYLEKGEYILNGCPSGGSESTYYMDVYSEGVLAGVDDGDGATFNVSSRSNRHGLNIRIKSGVTVSGLTFKPMIRPASVVDDTYAPYAMTNRELTSLITTKGYAKSITVAGNSSTGITDDISLPGYKAIGIVGCEANNTYLAIARSSLNVAAQTANITFHNFTTSSITSNVAYIVLYMKQ